MITSVHMIKKKRFRRGNVLQDQCTGKIYIYVKRIDNKKAHLIQLDQYGDPIGMVIQETKNLGPVLLVPETFKSIEI